ncbi:MAG TPA: cytochrome c biogenesis protein CcsA [Acidimicrobiales bacterium]|nr:cytochrome c biogenesis protein CcsA [Acidimicrobiales bacterium]
MITAPESTGSPATRVLGAVTLGGVALLVFFAFVVSPADLVQGDSVRLMYVHVPSAWTAYAMCAIATGASIRYLRKGTDGADITAHAAVEIAAVFTALTLVTGSVWGRPTWGVYWVWDARLTTTALLMLLLLGYLAIRQVDAAPEVRAKRASVVGVLLVPNVILVHQSVEWWRSLHQDPTVLARDLDPKIDGMMLFTLMLGVAVFSLIAAWLLIHRFRLAWLERQVEASGLDDAIEARRAEALAHAEAVTTAPSEPTRSEPTADEPGVAR